MAECQLHEGDTLVIYSDGVTEALSETDEEFGDERFEGALVATRIVRRRRGSTRY